MLVCDFKCKLAREQTQTTPTPTSYLLNPHLLLFLEWKEESTPEAFLDHTVVIGRPSLSQGRAPLRSLASAIPIQSMSDRTPVSVQYNILTLD